MLYLFARAIRRAQLPIVYTQGYNPRPKLWLLLPKPLGVSCLDDLLLVDLCDDCSSEEFADRLALCLPRGIKLRRSFKLGPVRSPQPRAAAYSLELSQQDAAKVVAAKGVQLLQDDYGTWTTKPWKFEGFREDLSTVTMILSNGKVLADQSYNWQTGDSSVLPCRIRSTGLRSIYIP